MTRRRASDGAEAHKTHFLFVGDRCNILHVVRAPSREPKEVSTYSICGSLILLPALVLAGVSMTRRSMTRSHVMRHLMLALIFLFGASSLVASQDVFRSTEYVFDTSGISGAGTVISADTFGAG